VHERSSETIRNRPSSERTGGSRSEGVRGTGHREICKEQRRKLVKGEFMKSSEPSIVGGHVAKIHIFQRLREDKCGEGENSRK
jgi:hypothetical protein